MAPYVPAQAIAEARRARGAGFDLASASQGCPFHVDIPALVRQVAEGDFDEALGTIRRSHPFPSVFGRMCHRFCENAVQGIEGVEGPALRELERFVGDYGDPALVPLVPERPPSGKRVAIIGAGSGGLAGAWMLRRLGHDVDVYDAHEVPGGMLVMGYSPWRMSRYGVRRENDPSAWGARFLGGIRVDRERLEQIVQTYDLVLITTGLYHAYPLGIPGEEAEGVWNVLDFIWQVSNGVFVGPTRRTLVIGAGQASLDASRSARRLGAEVTICYRRTREHSGIGHGSARYVEEFSALDDEGIDYMFLIQPVSILVDASNHVRGVTFVRTEMAETLHADGKPEILTVPGSEFTLECDLVVEAIGEGADLSLFPNWLEISEGRLVVDRSTHRTSDPRVFAAGDIAGELANEGAALGAIQAAQTMDSILRGEPLLRFELKPLRRGGWQPRPSAIGPPREP